jgi:hypothetical protein
MTTVAVTAPSASDPGTPTDVTYAYIAAGGTSWNSFTKEAAFTELGKVISEGGSVICGYPVQDILGRKAVFVKPIGVDQFYFDSFDDAAYQLEAVGVWSHDGRPRLRPLSVAQAPAQRSSGPIDATSFASAFGASFKGLLTGIPGRHGYRTGSVAFQLRDLSTNRVSPFTSAKVQTVFRQRARPFALMVRNAVNG